MTPGIWHRKETGSGSLIKDGRAHFDGFHWIDLFPSAGDHTSAVGHLGKSSNSAAYSALEELRHNPEALFYKTEH